MNTAVDTPNMLEEYARVAGRDVIDHLRQLVDRISGLRVVHVNSTRIGGGVAEILYKLVPLMQELGLDTSWEVIEGDDAFFSVHQKHAQRVTRKPD
jgi:trehalose synthase